MAMQGSDTATIGKPAPNCTTNDGRANQRWDGHPHHIHLGCLVDKD
jgi:hypothetical protein